MGYYIVVKCIKEENALNIRKGLIPTVLGTAVSATGYALKQNRKVSSMVANQTLYLDSDLLTLH